MRRLRWTAGSDPWGLTPRGLTPVLAALALLAAGCGAESEAGGDLPAGRQIAVIASVEPTVHLFAEPVRARLEIVVDRDRLDPDRIEVEPGFLPYDVYGQSEERERRGGLEIITREYLLRCLRIACIPEILASAAGEAESGRGERQTIRMRPAFVRYDDPDGEERIVARGRWPETVSVSRIKESDVPRFGYVFKTSATPLPEADYRVSPAVLGGGLLAAGLALLLLPAVLLVGWFRGRRPAEPVAEPEPELTPLQRALLLVEWARDRENGAERREALEVLAGELDAADREELSSAARTLAWSAPSPAPGAADELVRAVREGDSHA
jgi:hypothetical protein